MPLLESLLLGQFATFTLVLARVGGLVMTAPLFGTRAAPMQIRALLAVALSLLVTPLHLGLAPVELGNLFVFGKLLLGEALLGVLLGYGVAIFFTGIQLTGQVISQLGGTALSDVFDPTLDTNISVYSQLFYFVTLVMFALLGGHRLMMEALLDTFTWLPPGRATLGYGYVDALITLLSQGFLLGMRAAAPAMTALLLSTIVLGLIGRTVPQINILVVGFSVNAMVTLVALAVSIGGVAWAFPQQVAAMIDVILDAVRSSVPPPGG